MSALPAFSRRLLAVSVALLAGLSSSAFAGGVGIDDKGEFFSASAKASAQRQISDLQRDVRKDFAVETFPAIPAEAGSAPNAADKAVLNRFMEQWAEKRAREKGVNGLYALLVKTPPHLQVVVGNDTQKKAFTLRDRDTLVSLMLAKLKAKDYDGALVDGTNFVAATMRGHAGSGAGTGRNVIQVERPDGAAAHAQKSSWSWVVPLVVVGLGAWLVIGLFRAMFRGGGSGSTMNSGMGGGGFGGGGGGGFMSSLMGGLFGAAAGMWMYDRFFGHESSAASSSWNDPGNDSGPGGFSGQDSDFSGGSGGSFGDDSGGSSNGGGGGDFGGGGDSGGGGDFGGGGDSGGGGGDF